MRIAALTLSSARAVVLALIFSGTCLLSAAQAADVEGSQDHPLIGRYEGSEIVGYNVVEYDEVRILEGPFEPVGAMEQTGPGFRTLEGRSILIYYSLPPGRSTLEVLRNYEASLRAKGFEIAFVCATSDGSCFHSGSPEAGYLLGEAVGHPGRLPMLAGNYVHNWFQQRGRYLFAVRQGQESTVHAGLFFGESNAGSVAVVRVVESQPMESGKTVFLEASQMERAIAAEGRISLYGILFDFDKDSLRPESRPTLAEIAKLLQTRPELKLSIVGHTDNLGTAEYNLDLSRRRAANVVAALTSEFGIDSGRLTADGAGLTAPVASNDTEDGRAQNRRVELIAR